MTESTIQIIVVAALTALPSTIAALAAWRQAKHASEDTVANLALTADTKQQTKIISEKTDALHATAEHIVELTNSTMSKLKADLVSAKQEIAELKAMVGSMAVERRERERERERE